ncbi:MAG: phosphate starvation-inducible protein PsiF [Hyphomicrobiaceae bacterium]|nr:MAG: phosphate starvation-inducible protein PsiF [Hyphomicrobiaceae bacterium]
MKSILIASAAALLITAGAAAAQTQTKDKAPPKPRSEASIECSKQADAKGLKGKERKKFRAKCKREYGKKAA